MKKDLSNNFPNIYNDCAISLDFRSVKTYGTHCVNALMPRSKSSQTVLTILPGYSLLKRFLRKNFDWPSSVCDQYNFYYFNDYCFSGGVNNLTAFDIKGSTLNSLRNNDWFKNPKFPVSVSHISFHPNRVMMGYSLHDCSVVVSCLDAKKWRPNVSL